MITVAFAPDGKTLASASCQRSRESKAELKLWDIATGTERASVAVPGISRISGLAFAPDGLTLATCGDTDGAHGGVLLLDLRSGHWHTLPSAEPGVWWRWGFRGTARCWP